jgi:hypothetical protein
MIGTGSRSVAVPVSLPPETSISHVRPSSSIPEGAGAGAAITLAVSVACSAWTWTAPDGRLTAAPPGTLSPAAFPASIGTDADPAGNDADGARLAPLDACWVTHPAAPAATPSTTRRAVAARPQTPLPDVMRRITPPPALTPQA